MPKLTKEQLKEIAKKYHSFRFNYEELVNLGEIYQRKFAEQYSGISDAVMTLEERRDIINEGIALTIMAYDHNKIEEIDVRNFCDIAGINLKQFDALYDNITSPVRGRFISEGLYDIDLDGNLIDTKIDLDFKEPKKDDYLSDDNLSVYEKAKLKHQAKIDDRIKSFPSDLLKGDRKILLDRDFFESLFKTNNLKHPAPNNEADTPLYKKVRNNMDYIKEQDAGVNPKGNKYCAIDRIKNYVELSNSFKAKTALDFIKGPINFIMEWWTLKNVKNEIKNRYNISDKTIDTIEVVANTKAIANKFQLLEEDGNILTTDPTQEEIDAISSKTKKSMGTMIAKNNLQKIQMEFNNENKNLSNKKLAGNKIMVPSKDDLDQSIDDYNL